MHFRQAVVTLVIILILSFGTDISGRVTHEYNLVQVIPYVFVLIGGIAGINVFVIAADRNCNRNIYYACDRSYWCI